MNSNAELDRIDIDEIPEEIYLTWDPIALTFASGIHECDLLSSLERASRLAGEVC